MGKIKDLHELSNECVSYLMNDDNRAVSKTTFDICLHHIKKAYEIGKSEALEQGELVVAVNNLIENMDLKSIRYLHDNYIGSKRMPDDTSILSVIDALGKLSNSKR